MAVTRTQPVLTAPTAIRQCHVAVWPVHVAILTAGPTFTVHLLTAGLTVHLLTAGPTFTVHLLTAGPTFTVHLLTAGPTFTVHPLTSGPTVHLLAAGPPTYCRSQTDRYPRHIRWVRCMEKSELMERYDSVGRP